MNANKEQVDNFLNTMENEGFDVSFFYKFIKKKFSIQTQKLKNGNFDKEVLKVFFVDTDSLIEEYKGKESYDFKKKSVNSLKKIEDKILSEDLTRIKNEFFEFSEKMLPMLLAKKNISALDVIDLSKEHESLNVDYLKYIEDDGFIQIELFERAIKSAVGSNLKSMDFYMMRLDDLFDNTEVMKKILKKYTAQYPYLDKQKIASEIKEELDHYAGVFKLKKVLTAMDDEYKKENNEFTRDVVREEKELKIKSTLTNVEDFYYLARKKKRQIVAYLGPTNSGKTHAALAELEQADTGIYLAPLRLLAREIYDDKSSKLNISLATGEEVIKHKYETHVSATIEMLDIYTEYDVGVIDEIQMIEDDQRGNAWARALLGLNADKVVVVGSYNVLPILEKIVEKCGDVLEVKEFERLNPLKISTVDIKPDEIEKGDAVICFSRKAIYELEGIVAKQGFSTAMVYGALPPETRLKQAESFNEGESDVLIATNAIGYGLNLSIKRVLFATVSKFNGIDIAAINKSEFLQIAGRAGRFKMFDEGQVNYLNYGKKWQKFDYEDYEFLASDSHIPPRNILQGNYFPEYEHLKEFSQIKEFENKLSDIIEVYAEYYEDSSKTFQLSEIGAFRDNARVIDDLCIDLNLRDKYRYSFAPIPGESKGQIIFEDFIGMLSSEVEIDIEYFSFYHYHTKEEFSIVASVKYLEEVSADMMLYLWLMRRYQSANYMIGSAHLNTGLEDHLVEVLEQYKIVSLNIDEKLKEMCGGSIKNIGNDS